jgi:archaellum biogenesis ATPase FlaH
MQKAGVDSVLFDKTIDDYTLNTYSAKKAKKEIEEILDLIREGTLPSKSLVLIGESYTGKSLLASLIIKEALSVGMSAMQTSLDLFVENYYKRDSYHVTVQDIVSFDVFSLDIPLAFPTRLAPYLLKFIYRERTYKGKFTIYTTQYTPAALSKEFKDEDIKNLFRDKNKVTMLTIKRDGDSNDL